MGAGSSWVVPSGIGTVKVLALLVVLADGLEGDAPLTGSRSTSMELRPLMADCDRADRRRRSSGGRLRGWVLGSNLGRRDEEPVSEECRELREGREEDADLTESICELGRDDDLRGDLVGDLVGDGGSERELRESSRSSKGLRSEDVEEDFLEDAFLLPFPLPKNFIWARRLCGRS